MSSCSICKVISQIWELTHDLKISARNVIIAQNNTIWSQKQIIAISQQHGCLQNAVSGGIIMTRCLCTRSFSNIASTIVIVIHEMQSITIESLQTMLENRTHKLLICHMKKPNQGNKALSLSIDESSQLLSQYLWYGLDCIQWKSSMATCWNPKTNHHSMKLQ